MLSAKLQERKRPGSAAEDFLVSSWLIVNIEGGQLMKFCLCFFAAQHALMLKRRMSITAIMVHSMLMYRE